MSDRDTSSISEPECTGSSPNLTILPPHTPLSFTSSVPPPISPSLTSWDSWSSLSSSPEEEEDNHQSTTNSEDLSSVSDTVFSSDNVNDDDEEEEELREVLIKKSQKLSLMTSSQVVLVH